MPKQSIWRLEDSEGHGVYRSAWWKTIDIVDPLLHPTPEEDSDLVKGCMTSGIQLFDRDFFYGFKDLTQYKRWVHQKEWRKILSENGVVLKKYKIDKSKVSIGRTQVVFLKKDAKLVETREPHRV